MSERSHDPGTPLAVGVDGVEADRVRTVLRSVTARTVLAALYEDSGSATTAATVAARTNLTTETARSHLQALTDADLLEVVEEHDVEGESGTTAYTVPDRPVVVVATDETRDGREVVRWLLSAVAILALASVVVQAVLGGGVSRLFDGTVGPTGGLSPGISFFAGGLVVLLAAAAGWFLWHRRRSDAVTAGSE